MGDRHALYAVNVDVAGGAGSDVFIDQLSTFSVSAGIAELLEGSDGLVDPSYTAVREQRPSITFDTSAIATVLAQIGIAGLAVTADADEYGADFYFQLIAEGGTRTAGANHRRLRMPQGIIVPRRLSAAQGGNAVLSLEALPTYDETNNPLVLATSQSLVGSPSVGELFTVGPVIVNGTTVGDVMGIDIDFGIDVRTETSDGLVWPTYCYIAARQPLITVRCRDVSLLNTLGITGTAQSATDSVIWFRKRAEGGTLTADTTAQHISVTIDEGRIEVSRISGNVPLEVELRIRPTYDGSNAIMVINTAAAIS